MERAPGSRLELRLDQFEQPANHVSVVLFVPQAAKDAVGSRKLIQDLFEMAARCQRAGATGMKEIAEAIHRDAAEPATKGAGPQIVTEVGQLADDDCEDL